MLPLRGFRIARQISCSARAFKNQGCPPERDGQAPGGGEGGCECQQKPQKCEPKVPKKPKKAGRMCGTPGEEHSPGPFRDQGIPDHCSKEKAVECIKKLQELQKMWGAVAAASDPGARAAPAKRSSSGCPPRPPARDEGGISPVVLFLAGAALLAAIVWWVINNNEEPKEGEANAEKDEKPQQ